jgi:cyclopropane fatty-acyl-phospholipid synthase-like methyltransferase
MPLGQPLRRDHPDSEWAAVVFWGDLLADSWSQLTECVRTGDNAMRIMQRGNIRSRWFEEPNAWAIFGAVMGMAPAEDYMPIAEACHLSTAHTVADLGGGGGALLSAALRCYPALRGMLVEQSAFVANARLRLQNDGLSSRIEVHSSDLLQSIPNGPDVYMLKHVLHGYNDTQAVQILKNCRSAMPLDGRVLIIEFVLPDLTNQVDTGLEERLMSDLNMLAVTGGKERSDGEWRSLLSEAQLQCLEIRSVSGTDISIIESSGRC